MIYPHVTVNLFNYMAFVTVLISSRLSYGVIGLPEFVSADPSADQLYVSPLGALPFSLSSLLTVEPRLNSLDVPSPARTVSGVVGQ